MKVVSEWEITKGNIFIFLQPMEKPDSHVNGDAMCQRTSKRYAAPEERKRKDTHTHGLDTQITCFQTWPMFSNFYQDQIMQNSTLQSYKNIGKLLCLETWVDYSSPLTFHIVNKSQIRSILKCMLAN